MAQKRKKKANKKTAKNKTGRKIKWEGKEKAYIRQILGEMHGELAPQVENLLKAQKMLSVVINLEDLMKNDSKLTDEDIKQLRGALTNIPMNQIEHLVKKLDG